MFDRLVLEKRFNRFGFEENLLAEHANELNIPIVFTYEKTVVRNHFKFNTYDLVAGSVGFMHHVMRNLNIEVTDLYGYPDVLKQYMHRPILPLYTIRNLRSYFEQGGMPIFVKSAQTKKFTGFVADSITDPRFNGAGNQTKIITTSVVNFLTEWRCYVMNGRLVHVANVPGNLVDISKDNLKTINDMLLTLSISVELSSYSLDVGMLDTGQLALVEVNDAYSLGAYNGITPKEYWDVIATRWAQLRGN